ncbi:MAG TPA: hypothetical protein VHO69_13605 [Phototrophicaceae bacterium]|jgi:hypothetical protein|nr:hypothetical protein [Phototrophicaceae bacterium]
MNNNPLNRKALSRASILGVSLGVGAIVLFMVLWLVLGQLEVEKFTRLFIALCLPPAAIAGILGVYLLVVRPANGDGDKNP